MAYLRCVPSLKELTTSQVAINLCQDNRFKEVALRLERPTYASDTWDYSSYEIRFRNVGTWDKALEEQCDRLTEELPQSLKQDIHIWMSRIALEYVSYARRMEMLFGLTRYFMVNFLIREDWTSNCRLNEMKLAKRLLRNEKLTDLQRYRIACVYCLHRSIPELWNSLTVEQKQFITRDSSRYWGHNKLHEGNPFVLLWSYYLDGHREEELTGKKNRLWIYATLLAVEYGNKAILMQCWKRLNKDALEQRIISCALLAVQKWKCVQSRKNWRKHLVSNSYHGSFGIYCYCCNYAYARKFNLPYYYSELVFFFLSKMHDGQQVSFFQRAFENPEYKLPDEQNSQHYRIYLLGDAGFTILYAFLEWPLQDYFLETLTRLWEKVPKDIYGNCLLSLARHNSGSFDPRTDGSSGKFYKKMYLHYDYCSILWNLWDKTPEEYKQFVFYFEDFEGRASQPIIHYLLRELLNLTPLQKKDVALFKHVWKDVPLEKRKMLVGSISADNCYTNICWTFVEKGMWPFLNSVLEECLPSQEIPDFKMIFTLNKVLCMNKLKDDDEEYVNDFINWVFELDSDKREFKCNMINHDSSLQICSDLLEKEEINKLEFIINFCLPSEDVKLQFKADVVKKACLRLLRHCAWEKMDKCLHWVFDTEEKIISFKKELFDSFASDAVLYNFVFNRLGEKNIEEFNEWFHLSPEELVNLKRKTFRRERGKKRCSVSENESTLAKNSRI